MTAFEVTIRGPDRKQEGRPGHTGQGDVSLEGYLGGLLGSRAGWRVEDVSRIAWVCLVCAYSVWTYLRGLCANVSVPPVYVGTPRVPFLAVHWWRRS